MIAPLQPASGTVSALVLLSGGLDSQLAVCVLREQGIDVQAVVFQSPFFDSAPARRAAGQLAVPLRVVDFAADMVALLKNPPHGFGRCLNPCVDCHMTMLRRTGELLEAEGFHFIATGEVLQQRPMSQNPRSLRTVAEGSGYGPLIVRPLSARCLPETRPEREGWVDRERLLDIQGRGRKRQLALARRYSLTDVPSPAGGCRLTDPGFCRRLDDLMKHEGLNGTRTLSLLRVGRHFRLRDDLKLIVGRHEQDNAFLEGTAELYDLVLKTTEIPGPSALLPFTAPPQSIEQAAAICARYADGEAGRRVAIKVRSSTGARCLEALPADPADVERLRI